MHNKTISIFFQYNSENKEKKLILLQALLKSFPQIDFIIIIIKAMSNYLQKYHLKKVQPVKNRPRATYTDFLKSQQKTQKTNVIKIPTKRKIPAHRNYFQKQEEQTQQAIRTQKHIKMQSNPMIGDLSPKRPSSNIKANHRAHKSLNFKSGKDNSAGAKIITTIQDFFSKFLKNSEGCGCGQNCPWSAKFFRWVDVPIEIIKDHYTKIKVRWENVSKQENQMGKLGRIKEQYLKNYKQILKDIDRTQSDNLTFQSAIFKQRQKNILMSYAVQDPKVGYVQGMNIILSGILYHVRDEIKSFAIFRNIILVIRSIYLQNFIACYDHIKKIKQHLNLEVHDLYEMFEEVGVDLNIICLPWVLSLLTCVVPLDHLHLIYDGFIEEQWNFIYKICLAIFIYHKDHLLELADAGEIISLLSATNQLRADFDWEDIIMFGKSITL